MRLVAEKPESAALRALQREDPDQVASAVVEVEVVRALRSLGARQLATALEIADELDVLVTCDGRMSAAAETLGLRVLAPTQYVSAGTTRCPDLPATKGRRATSSHAHVSAATIASHPGARGPATLTTLNPRSFPWLSNSDAKVIEPMSFTITGPLTSL